MAARQLKDKRIVLTGASSGIGRALATNLIGVGAKVLITARRRDQLEGLRDGLHVSDSRCLVVSGDITCENVQEEILSICRDSWNGLDCLINNAGITALGRFESAAADRLRKVFEVNFFATSSLMRKTIPMLKNGNDPLIVNIGSILAHVAVPLKSEYCASKFAVRGLTESIRAELRESGIEILLVSPSTVQSNLFDAAIEDTTSLSWQSSSAMTPEFVAGKIIRAMIRRQPEIVLPFSGRALVWLSRMFPGLTRHLVTRFAR